MNKGEELMAEQKRVIDTLVIGAGQAGIAASEHLSNNKISHIVLEKKRIAEAWRTGRWDSLVANGPAWHDSFPNMEFKGGDPDRFIPKDEIAEYMEDYARQINAPIETGVEVTRVVSNTGRYGYTVETSTGTIEALNIVVATGPFQTPIIPTIAPKNPDLYQIHSAQYYNPQQLPEGAVLVIGAGSSGVQIADELQREGKKVYLSIGAHDRPPRSYRNRDFCWWLGVLGLWDAPANAPGKEHVTIAVSGANGGQTVDFRRLGHQGIILVGLTQSFDNNQVFFKDNLNENIRLGDENYLSLLDAADEYVKANGLDLPLEPEARQFLSNPPSMENPILSLNLEEAGITSIIWATGYAVDYSWIDIEQFQGQQRPKHQRGVSNEEGIYFLGLPWLSRRGSSFIWGVWHDAKYVADHIANRKKYTNYKDADQRS